MAAVHGKSGTCSFTGLAAMTVYSWSIDVQADVAESTVMGGTWKTFLAGFPSWTATCECQMPSTGVTVAAIGGAEAALSFQTTGGLGFTGNAISTGISPGLDKDGIASVSFTFQGSGALTEG
jgi:hypothetical protein